jgi:hypothetical protein
MYTSLWYAVMHNAYKMTIQTLSVWRRMTGTPTQTYRHCTNWNPFHWQYGLDFISHNIPSTMKCFSEEFRCYANHIITIVMMHVYQHYYAVSWSQTIIDSCQKFTYAFITSQLQACASSYLPINNHFHSYVTSLNLAISGLVSTVGKRVGPVIERSLVRNSHWTVTKFWAQLPSNGLLVSV